ncbi:LPS translocon maturation chaperone LptM [Ottowia thiooxydans]|uniref:LPS translocon maturation chaperone LptM n=1 Tax=Ottowia thiooxydans TaxID=219182 RepID=UPI0004119EFD|nr:lipoprotein [Ottowia thiooxydans]
MPLKLQPARILAIGLVLPIVAVILTACGQKGPLVIPGTVPAAERATLPQTVFGKPKRAAGEPAAVPAATNEQAPLPSALPNLPETQ